MKRSLLIGFFFSLIMATSCSDSEISEDRVPAAVVTAFKAKYPTAVISKWVTEKEGGKIVYEAIFKENDEEIKAEFYEDGSFLKEH